VDPIFTILVALLTLIISNIPIGLIQYVLLEYCSKSPGKRTEQFIEGMQKKSTVSLDPTAQAATAEGLKNDTPAPTRTEFGDVIRRKVSEGSGGFISASDQAQYAFAGTLDCTVLYCPVLVFSSTSQFVFFICLLDT
jgi:hypothetical protein